MNISMIDSVTPLIVKPPGNYYQESDGDDDNGLFEDPTSPPREHYAASHDEIGNGVAKQDETYGESDATDCEKRMLRSQRGSHRENGTKLDDRRDDATPCLDADVFIDGLKMENVETDTATKESSEKNLNGKSSGDESGTPAVSGGSDVMKKEREAHWSGTNSWVMLLDEQKSKDEADGDVSDEDVTDLVDRAESEVEAISKGERGAFDGLVAVLRILLPMVLVMADELKMLRGKIRTLLLGNRSLQKELHQARQESAREKEKETVSVGITALIQDDVVEKVSEKCSRCEETKHREVENQGREQTAGEEQKKQEETRRDIRKLRNQCRELVEVNHSWEKYSGKQEKKHADAMKKLKAQLASAEQKKKQVEKRLDDKFREYDQTLLHAKEMEKRQRVVSEQYRRDRDVLREKYEDVKTKLKEAYKEAQEKDTEIKRLNELLQAKDRKADIRIYKVMKKATGPPEEVAPSDEQYGIQVRKQHGEKAGAAMTPAPLEMTAKVLGQCEKHRDRDAQAKKQPGHGSASRPLSPRGPPMDAMKGGPLSLTTAELKDQVILYKEQMDAFRSDFNQERRDREKAIGQVDSLKKELEKTKIKLKELQRLRKQEEHDYYATSRQLGRLHFLPKETQEMRLKEFEHSRGRRNPAHGRNYADERGITEECFLEHIYAGID